MRTGQLIALTAACGVVLLGSLLSWVTFKAQLPVGGMDAQQAELMRQAMEHAMREALTITGWKGHVTLFGLTLPNWLVPVSAIAVAALAWARATDTWDTSPKIGIALSGYGVAHLVVLFVVLLANPGSTTIGIGAPISFLGSVGALGVAIITALWGDAHHAAPGHAPALWASRSVEAFPASPQPIDSYPAPNLPHVEQPQQATLGRVDPTMDD